MDRTAALREQHAGAQPEIERVDSEKIFHPLADGKPELDSHSELEKDDKNHAKPHHSKLGKVAEVLKKPFEHHPHPHPGHEGESAARLEADRKDKTSENWMG